jgi:glyoxylase-like metal-dependent hydrolase (beta-lactamase superfamily II)
MTDKVPEYELFATRYATREARRRDHFLGGDPHDGPMAMDYFSWVAIGRERVFVIDCGFTAETGARRSRSILRCPVDSLRLLGVAAETVQDVVVTHLHYDHVGNFHRFPNARFHLQDREMSYATGRFMRQHALAHSYEVEDVVGMVRLNYAGRVVFHDGPAVLAPGIELCPAGGHTAGLQFVRVNTRRGWVVVASDVSHYYENLTTDRPFPVAFHIGEILEGFDALRKAAPDPDHIIPGHDPLVMTRYPPPRPDLEGAVVRLDVPPVG